jgi:8-oxo-dGTP pyrophosphatase MutT (NUDIX family)
MGQGPETPNLAPGGEADAVARAIERYGQPVIRAVHYDVSQDSWRYWQMVRRGRAGEVVLLLRRRNGRYLVHTKGFYPQGAYRLPSGGIKPGEDLVEAVRREAAEETSLEASVEAFLAIVQHHFARGDEQIDFTSYVFLLQERGGALHPADEGEEITGFRELPLAGVVALAEELEALSPDWDDWGRFRASVHRVVGEVMGVT